MERWRECRLNLERTAGGRIVRLPNAALSPELTSSRAAATSAHTAPVTAVLSLTAVPLLPEMPLGLSAVATFSACLISRSDLLAWQSACGASCNNLHHSAGLGILQDILTKAASRRHIRKSACEGSALAPGTLVRNMSVHRPPHLLSKVAVGLTSDFSRAAQLGAGAACTGACTNRDKTTHS
jgi:hypothetical protein